MMVVGRSARQRTTGRNAHPTNELARSSISRTAEFVSLSIEMLQRLRDIKGTAPTGARNLDIISEMDP